MALNALVQLNYAKLNPATGEEFILVGGAFDGDDENIMADTAFGWLIIPRVMIADCILLSDAAALNRDELPNVWFVNDFVA